MEVLRVMVGGSRDIRNISELKRIIHEDLSTISAQNTDRELVLIHGGARGVDEIAAEIAYELGYELEEHTPDWQGQGVTAGHRRNTAMIENAHKCLFYWDGKSRGTEQAIGEARAYRKQLLITIVE